MEIFSVGFTQTTAERFFSRIRENGIRRLVDTRLNNVSQLSGFAKKDDLSYFLSELCDAEYIHLPFLAPTQEILKAYQNKVITWQEYEVKFNNLMADRKIEEKLSKDYFLIPSVLLCSEATADYCHRRLVLEYLKGKWGDLKITHL